MKWIGEVGVPVVIDVLVGIVHAEGLIDGGALVHEVYGAPGVSRYVADSQQSVDREVRGHSDALHCPSVNLTEATEATFDLHGDTAAPTLRSVYMCV